MFLVPFSDMGRMNEPGHAEEELNLNRVAEMPGLRRKRRGNGVRCRSISGRSGLAIPSEWGGPPGAQGREGRERLEKNPKLSCSRGMGRRPFSSSHRNGIRRMVRSFSRCRTGASGHSGRMAQPEFLPYFPHDGIAGVFSGFQFSAGEFVQQPV